MILTFYNILSKVLLTQTNSKINGCKLVSKLFKGPIYVSLMTWIQNENYVFEEILELLYN